MSMPISSNNLRTNPRFPYHRIIYCVSNWRIDCWGFFRKIVPGRLTAVFLCWRIPKSPFCSCRPLLRRPVKLIVRVVNLRWNIFRASFGWFWENTKFYQKLRQIYCMLHWEYLWIPITSAKPNITKCLTT